MSKTKQMDKLIKELGIKVAVRLLTKRKAEMILHNFGKKIGYY